MADAMEDGKELDFEAALAQLEALVGRLEGGDLSLDDSLRTFEEGVLLVRQCSERLQIAELRIQKLEEGSEKPLEIVEED